MLAVHRLLLAVLLAAFVLRLVGKIASTALLALLALGLLVLPIRCAATSLLRRCIALLLPARARIGLLLLTAIALLLVLSAIALLVTLQIAILFRAPVDPLARIARALLATTGSALLCTHEASSF
ncbi:MAG TPA: hypothetical protein VJ891_06890 [Casimicrobiaceae bacterium]|nr:hypothetical protein [Casimicrobiaceae bacterium]